MHTKARLSLTALSLLLGLASVAQAQAPTRYFLLSMGNSTYMGNAQNEADAVLAGSGQTGISSTLGTRGTGYKAMLGYQLSPSLAVEGGVLDTGSFNYRASASGSGLNADYRGLGLNVSALGLSALNSEVSVFGKLGLTYSAMLGSGSSGVALGSKEEKASLGYGLGGVYHLNDRLGLRAEWERLYSDVTLFSVGLQVRF
jgi:OOP family OmpA-OmpF porin